MRTFFVTQAYLMRKSAIGPFLKLMLYEAGLGSMLLSKSAYPAYSAGHWIILPPPLPRTDLQSYPNSWRLPMLSMILNDIK